MGEPFKIAINPVRGGRSFKPFPSDASIIENGISKDSFQFLNQQWNSHHFFRLVNLSKWVAVPSSYVQSSK